MTTLSAIRDQVTTGRFRTLPPNGAVAGLDPRLPSLTHSTHCWPTAADRRQSGHAGRPHLTHETYVSRSGCLKQVGAEADTSEGELGPGGMAMSLAARPRRAAVALDHHGLKYHVVDRPVVPAGLRLADRVNHLAARDYLAEDRVPAVEMRSRRGGDEELRAVRARPGVRHREQVGPVEGQVRMELVGERVTGTTGPRSQRVAALDHEVRYHPVEDGPVVELRRSGLAGSRVGPVPAALRQFDEVTHRLRRMVGKEPDDDRPAVGPQRRGKGIGHTEILPRTTQCPGTHAPERTPGRRHLGRFMRRPRS